MGYAPLPLFFVLLIKSEKLCKGKLILRSLVEVVRGGFPCIIGRRYIIISKVNI